MIDDDKPEVAENFTIELYPKSVSGDAVVVDPFICTVVIEPNDNANGILSINTSKTEKFQSPFFTEDSFIVRNNKTLVELFCFFTFTSHFLYFQVQLYKS